VFGFTSHVIVGLAVVTAGFIKLVLTLLHKMKDIHLINRYRCGCHYADQKYYMDPYCWEWEVELRKKLTDGSIGVLDKIEWN